MINPRRGSTLLILVLFLLLTQVSYSQSQRVAQSVGSSCFTEFFISPVNAEYNNQTFSITLCSINYMLQFNLLKISDELSINAVGHPSLAFAVGDYGFGGAAVPAYASVAFGAGSTYNSKANIGGFLGAGYEVIRAPIIAIDSRTSSGKSTITTTWHQPVFVGGFRYWNRADKLRQITLLIGQKDAYEGGTITANDLTKKSFHFRLSFDFFIKY